MAQNFFISPELWSAAHALVKKYSGAGPRYTSYPTAVEFSDQLNRSSWIDLVRQDHEEMGPEATASLYFHIPFCHTLCYFCACNKVITRDRSVVPRYLQALYRELDSYRTLFGDRTPAIEQIHWGGGSPNYLAPEEMVELHHATTEAFPRVLEHADVSIELDPRTTSREQIQALAKSGFNRVSLGVQDFNSDVQEAVNRVQPFEMTSELVAACRGEGFSGVNIDLIYGLPLQTADSFKRTVERLLEIKPDRIALYGYAHVTWLKKVQRALEREHLPSPDERIDIFLTALRMLCEAGYEFIGLDHFALPHDELALARKSGKLNRNFMGYTTHKGARIYAFGVSSISMLPCGMGQNQKEVPRYEEEISEHGLAIERGVACSRDDRLRWEIIERIMCQGEVNLSDIDERWRIDSSSYFAAAFDQLRPMIEDSLVELDGRTLRLTGLGRLFARNAAMAFDAYLALHRAKEKPVFSQTV